MTNSISPDKLKSTSSKIHESKESLIVTDLYAPIYRDIYRIIRAQQKKLGTKRKHSERLAFLMILEKISDLAEAISAGDDSQIILELLEIAAFNIQWVSLFWNQKTKDVEGSPFAEKNAQLLIEYFGQGLKPFIIGSLNEKPKFIAKGVNFTRSFMDVWERAQDFKSETVKILDSVDRLKSFEERLKNEE